ncbi:hypothetical protein DTO96_102537 [Ephemeroptericola cinctiostellae]|uniref:Uncharacterized protein n=1 Tax=Ephemeroptericola cinctiostellae TaxID=2268024 RepID=A0A345DEJ3_9BURK|nr:hypothetical protein [Ephemeroptericola cinctiostellae]AXF86781.1 hypothetical protein DTO96_102537 [Ephemeroptericola cinctiostellae]
MWTYSQSENKFVQKTELPADAVNVSDEVVARAHAAVAEGLPFVVLGADDITVAPSPAHVWYADTQRWMDYAYQYSDTTGGLYPTSMLASYTDVPKDLMPVTEGVALGINEARAQGLAFVIVDGETVDVAPSSEHDWDMDQRAWVLNTARAEARADALKKASVPTVVSIKQARLALLQADLLDDVDAVIAAAATPRSLKIEWEYASEVRREWVEASGLMTALKLDNEALDRLFVLAASL